MARYFIGARNYRDEVGLSFDGEIGLNIKNSRMDDYIKQMTQ